MIFAESLLENLQRLLVVLPCPSRISQILKHAAEIVDPYGYLRVVPPVRGFINLQRPLEMLSRPARSPKS